MDFCLDNIDGPRLDIELCSGNTIKRLVDVWNPGSNSIRTLNELENHDDIEFLL